MIKVEHKKRSSVTPADEIAQTSWTCKGIIVKIKNKKLGNGDYFNKKGVILGKTKI
eukprot:UN02229